MPHPRFAILLDGAFVQRRVRTIQRLDDLGGPVKR